MKAHELTKGQSYEFNSATYGGWTVMRYEGPCLNLVSEEVHVFTGPDGKALHLRDHLLSAVREIEKWGKR